MLANQLAGVLLTTYMNGAFYFVPSRIKTQCPCFTGLCGKIVQCVGTEQPNPDFNDVTLMFTLIIKTTLAANVSCLANQLTQTIMKYYGTYNTKKITTRLFRPLLNNTLPNQIRLLYFVYKENSRRGRFSFRAQRQAKGIVLELPSFDVIDYVTSGDRSRK